MGKKFKGLDKGHFYHGAMSWMGVGVEFAAVCGGMAWLGNQLDKLQNTSPGWMIMFFFAGFGIMLHLMLKRAKNIEDTEKKNRDIDDKKSS
jgi:F0F1-type ATP synthase assembly protein I